MSEETLRRFMNRLNTDSSFRAKLKESWAEAIEEFGLSPAEVMALASNDEDALRRLLVADASGYAAGFWQTIFCTAACVTALPRSCRPGAYTAEGNICGPTANCGNMGR